MLDKAIHDHINADDDCQFGATWWQAGGTIGPWEGIGIGLVVVGGDPTSEDPFAIVTSTGSSLASTTAVDISVYGGNRAYQANEALASFGLYNMPTTVDDVRKLADITCDLLRQAEGHVRAHPHWGHALTCACGHRGHNVVPSGGCDAICPQCLANITNRAEATVTHRRRLPGLSADSSRGALISWLCSNDRNGCYTDEDMRAEGWDPMTREEAWELVAAALEDEIANS